MNRTLALLIAGLAAVLLSGCADAGPSTTIDITLTDFQFTPNRFTVPAGAEIAVHASHEGAVVHDFLIMDRGADVADHFDESDRARVFWELRLEPNQTRSGTFTAPAEPGVYQIVCGTPGHVQAGMVGELIVVAAP
jgi:uncharacterized cupredoxin-like copper-binding protein